MPLRGKALYSNEVKPGYLFQIFWAWWDASLGGTMKKKILLTIIPTIIVLGILIFVLIFIYKNQNKKAKGEGTITIEVINLTETVINEKYTYSSGDTLTKIIEEEYNADISYSDYGAFVNGFPNCMPDNTKGEWIIVYVNDVSASEGISYLELKDGYKYTFKIEVYNY